jgi:hypothetical protein
MWEKLPAILMFGAMALMWGVVVPMAFWLAYHAPLDGDRDGKDH